MAENFAFDLIGNKISKCNGDIAIMLIDHDTASIAYLTSMFQKLSYKVMSVNMASEAVSMIERQKDIVLVIANIEMPHIDSHWFHTSLLTKNIPFILINPEMKTDESSNCLKERACYFLTKPISEKDINNMLQHVLPGMSQKLKEISITKSEEDIMEEHKKQIEAFRETLKWQRTGETSSLERRLFMRTFTAFEEYQKRRNIVNDEGKNKPMCSIEIENKRKEEDKMESNVGERVDLWTCERHMKFLSAIHTLGDKDSHPKSILKIMNDPNLTQQQVATHLQKYKAQVDQMNDTLLRNEWFKIAKTFEYPWEYKYPSKALSNLANNFISAEKPIEENDTKIIKFLLGGKMDLSNYSFSGNISNNSFMEVDGVAGVTNNTPPCNISPTTNVNYADLVSTSLTSNNISDLSGLPSSVGSSSNTGNVIPFKINMEESQVHYEEGYDVPIEDMISFDNDINEMDMWYVLGNNGSSEENILFNTHIGHDAYNTPMEEGDQSHGDDECLNWIDNVLNEDA